MKRTGIYFTALVRLFSYWLTDVAQNGLSTKTGYFESSKFKTEKTNATPDQSNKRQLSFSTTVADDDDDDDCRVTQ